MRQEIHHLPLDPGHAMADPGRRHAERACTQRWATCAGRAFITNHARPSYRSGPVKSLFPFALSLSKPFDRLRANGFHFMVPEQ